MLRLSSNVNAQDSTRPFIRLLKSYIGQKFRSEIKNDQTREVTLKEVTSDYLLFVTEEHLGVAVTIVKPLCYISKVLIYRFPNSQKEYLHLIAFGNEGDMEVIPWPPKEISAKDRSSIQSFQIIQASKDALINDLNNIAANAYQYKIRPQSMRGGQGSYLGYNIPNLMSTNENGRYSCLEQNDNLLLMGISIADSNCVVKTKLDPNGNLHDWQYYGEFK
jgi:hypothetical protein